MARPTTSGTITSQEFRTLNQAVNQEIREVARIGFA
jgi:hypothetical protein